ncbi:golgin subfamily A member 6-like protein 2 [Lepisosteus oculatus]|uniref:golgin subfamily A member 6-like protein 2 n=1 Tax=Lepisosteus oculatus TaxID=7918 RepID=UPI0037138F86
MSAVSLEVRWYKGSSGELVHQYTDRRETEGPAYQGRVQLFHQELERGNVSLLLKDVRTSDQSTYICHISSVKGDERESHLEILVTDQHFKLMVPLEFLSVSVGSDIVLPCHLTPETSAVSLEVRWYKGSSRELVHQYTDRRETEGPGYQGRVQLFHQELERGNVSLLLKDVRTSDQNIYTCHISSVKGDEQESQLEILVTDSVSEDLPAPETPVPVTEKLEEENKKLQNEREKPEEENEKLQNDKEKLEEENKKLQNDKEKLEEENKKLQNDKDKKVAELEEKNTQLQNNKEKLEEENKKLQNDKEKLEEENKKLQNDKVKLEEENKKLQNDKEKPEEENEKLQNDKEMSEEQNDKLQNDRSTVLFVVLFKG